ncbi:MAG: SDR family oxidoreductase [Betaproteobacteria bacterium]|jgi:NAD(P)-dependent dehydrogenase (short-subunit alcohol dehydrogenase family)|nr:SDR family oxidoreductase [Betaproteobacteria bacterium]
MHNPHNRVALITGAARGIGAASAAALLADGWRVVFSGRDVAALQAAIARAAAEAAAHGPIHERAIAVQADVTDEASVAALFDTTLGHFGRVDLLFNNAGLFAPKGLLEDIEFAAWKQVVDTNLNGVFLCTQHAFRVMKSQSPRGGRIINNGSISAHAPRPHSSAYTATKHAVTGLTKSASLDGRQYNIAVGQIDIGNAATDMTTAFTQGVVQADGSTKVEPVMEVSHVAQAVVYMANLPLSANVLHMTVMATNMPFVGRG